jgi:DNA polymerase III epsilon subunit-like protein
LRSTSRQATSQPDSPCELGIAVVRGGVVREVHNWLIKPPQWPYFSPVQHRRSMAITPQDVAQAPTWREIWEEVEGILRDQVVVAHNAAFDMNVLRSTLVGQGLRYPSFTYFCSVSMCRKVWPGRTSYGPGPHVCDAMASGSSITARAMMLRPPLNSSYAPRINGLRSISPSSSLTPR